MTYLKSDSHVHTNYSNDADPKATFQAYINQAKKRNIKEITFTDHVDFDAKHPLFYNQIDYEKYIEDFKSVKDNTDIHLKLGVEIGYQTHMKNQTNSFLNKYPFEFVILSVHYVDEKDLYTKEYFEGKTKKESYQTYFELCLEAINNTPEFTVFGHLDYITRYSPYGDYKYKEYKKIIDEILMALIEKGKGLEINTSGYKTENRQYPKEVVVNRFKELGGTLISYGSDAHNVSELGVKSSLIE